MRSASAERTHTTTLLFLLAFKKNSGVVAEAAGKTLTIKNCTATLDGAAANIADYVGGSQEGNCTVTIE